MTDRAGLLLIPGSKVKLNGAQIGTVAAVDETSDGRAQLMLAIDPARLRIVPDNVHVEIGSQTVFGAKSVEFTPPPDPSATPLRAGQVLDSRHVTVEVNTIFEQLNSVLSHIEPAKLNETLGAVSTAFSGRGDAFGRSLTDFNAFLAKIEPSLPQLSGDLRTLPDVANAYADAAPDLDRHRAQWHGDQPHASSTSSPISTDSWSPASAWPTSATTSSAVTATLWQTSCICWCRRRT